MIVNYRKHSKKISAVAVVMLIVTGFIFFTLTGFANEGQSTSSPLEFKRPIALENKPPGMGDKSNIIIRVTKKGEIWVEGKQIDISSLQSRMERFKKEYPEGNVVIVGDIESPLGKIINVLDHVKMTGITNVAVATRK